MADTQPQAPSVDGESKTFESTPLSVEKIASILRPLVGQFEVDLNYTGNKSTSNIDSLLQKMHEEAKRIGIPYPEGSHSGKSFKVGAWYAHLCYPGHSLEVRAYTGIFTWLAIVADDSIFKDPKPWQNFIAHFQSGRKQDTHLAQAWAGHLRMCDKYYSPVVAGLIVTSSLNFTIINVVEGSELPKMSRTTGGTHWPYYLRDKDGISEAYVWMTFPKESYPEVSSYMEAVPDMNKYISFTNDILSFYKEEKAGEKNNYLHSRAFYEGKDVYTVFRDVMQETVEAHRRIQVVLQGREPYAQAWHAHAMGFVAMHKTQNERYHLRELGLSE
ncbi:isoprenoid synthase domain-containing protein [Nemania sp. FL0916]|nr:isoprenoid synthase domain-containing protein [Nemania sp. FL0916]